MKITHPQLNGVGHSGSCTLCSNHKAHGDKNNNFTFTTNTETLINLLSDVLVEKNSSKKQFKFS